jgi:hypothetical protein
MWTVMNVYMGRRKDKEQALEKNSLSLSLSLWKEELCIYVLYMCIHVYMYGCMPCLVNLYM